MKHIAKSLFDKYQSGDCNPEEQAIVENWLTFGDATKLDLSEEELDADLKVIAERVNTIPVVKRGKLWPRIAVAAAAVIGMAVCVYFFNNERGVLKQVQDDVVYKQDIAPGKNTAILTVNGKQTQLSDDKTGVVINANTITYNDGSAISEAAAESLTLTTPRGGTYYALLSDGTKIWLNADSKLELLPNFWNKAQRLVILTGEAYFEVAKNKLLPFRVHSAGQEVTVLGTHFNISAYQGEGIRTTLLEGSVKVSSSRGKRSDERSLPAVRDDVVLKPNQQSLVTGSQGITVKQVDAEESIAWKEGYFGFSNETLESVMKKVSRWYDVQVVFVNEAVKQKIILGSVSRYENLSKVIRVLERLEVAEFKIEGKTITIDKKK